MVPMGLLVLLVQVFLWLRIHLETQEFQVYLVLRTHRNYQTNLVFQLVRWSQRNPQVLQVPWSP